MHTGTHADAPLHFIDGGASIDEVPLEPFIGPCTVIEVPEGAITGEDINEKFPQKCERLLIKGGGKAYFHSSAADELADIGLKLIGTDSLSVGVKGDQVAPQAMREPIAQTAPDDNPFDDDSVNVEERIWTVDEVTAGNASQGDNSEVGDDELDALLNDILTPYN